MDKKYPSYTDAMTLSITTKIPSSLREGETGMKIKEYDTPNSSHTIGVPI